MADASLHKRPKSHSSHPPNLSLQAQVSLTRSLTGLPVTITAERRSSDQRDRSLVARTHRSAHGCVHSTPCIDYAEKVSSKNKNNEALALCASWSDSRLFGLLYHNFIFRFWNKFPWIFLKWEWWKKIESKHYIHRRRSALFFRNKSLKNRENTMRNKCLICEILSSIDGLLPTGESNALRDSAASNQHSSTYLWFTCLPSPRSCLSSVRWHGSQIKIPPEPICVFCFDLWLLSRPLVQGTIPSGLFAKNHSKLAQDVVYDKVT